MLGRRLAATTGTPCVTTLPQGNLGAVNGHDRHHDHVGVDQDLGGLVRLVVNRAQYRGERIAAMPQPPRPSELEAAAILLGVDHEHPTRTDH